MAGRPGVRCLCAVGPVGVQSGLRRSLRVRVKGGPAGGQLPQNGGGAEWDGPPLPTEEGGPACPARPGPPRSGETLCESAHCVRINRKGSSFGTVGPGIVRRK